MLKFAVSFLPLVFLASAERGCSPFSIRLGDGTAENPVEASGIATGYYVPGNDVTKCTLTCNPDDDNVKAVLTIAYDRVPGLMEDPNADWE
jgi:hypothetical protein